MRNVEDILLDTLMIKLSQATGIPTGLIDVKMPDTEFVNKFDGSNQPATNKPQFPSLGFTYYADPVMKYNNYGDYQLIPSTWDTTVEYQPLGEIVLFVAIHLFTKTRYDQNNIGNNIAMELMSNKYYNFVNDVLTGEYFSVKFNRMRDMDSHQPYHKIFMVECNTRILKEVSGYVVDEIDTNFRTGTALINASISQNAAPPVKVEYLNRPRNEELIIDGFVNEGDFERTIVSGASQATDDTIIMYPNANP